MTTPPVAGGLNLHKLRMKVDIFVTRGILVISVKSFRA